ncbi:hypothetical protein ACFRCW_38010 [Streptomyces sp. NPDC056653]|uniref:hypothetical protein n=1 Tax=Streptomyces sp. NPDC056653 TaxID=3345894 RepID=UPI0036CD05C4
MTGCIKGEHDFPVEDETGAYCAEHGVTLLWHHDAEITWDDPLAAPADKEQQ